jgi:anti-sigma regulatory factor (Ser/Thr protein kinase)
VSDSLGRHPAVALEVPARSDEVAGIRKAIGALGRGVGIDEDRLADIALAVGEACANAVVHAYPDREPGTLRVTAEVTPTASRSSSPTTARAWRPVRIPRGSASGCRS